jgi:branched-chain amino acid transport system substrate-binding protein
MKLTATIAAIALLAAQAPAHAQAKEQFVPAMFYWIGPYAAGGSGIAGGMLDYLEMLNLRDGGINGVKFTWEKCETEYNNARGVEPAGGPRLHRSGRAGRSAFGLGDPALHAASGGVLRDR